jgi:hypothetical protein
MPSHYIIAHQAQGAALWITIGVLVFAGIAAYARRLHRQGEYARPLALWSTILIGVADFVAVILAALLAGQATTGFGFIVGIILTIIISALAGTTLAQTVASRRGIGISMRDAITAPRQHPLPSFLGAVVGLAFIVFGLASVVPGVIIGALFGASLSHGQQVRKTQMTIDQLQSPLAAVLGVSESEIDSMSWGVTPQGEIIIPRPNAKVLNHINAIPGRLVQYLPDLYMETASATEIVLSPLDDDTKSRREQLAQHEGLVTDIRPGGSFMPTTEAGNVDLDLSDEEF